MLIVLIRFTQFIHMAYRDNILVNTERTKKEKNKEKENNNNKPYHTATIIH